MTANTIFQTKIDGMATGQNPSRKPSIPRLSDEPGAEAPKCLPSIPHTFEGFSP
jgi:hypothetical protein